jgi:intein-encoded DNA endonuclease-like protein
MTELQQTVIQLLKEGMVPSQIAKKLNKSKSTISSVIKRFNIIDYNKLNENTCVHDYFDKIDTEEKAYLLGLFLADGWVSKTRFGISLQIEDLEILEKFKVLTDNKTLIRNRSTSVHKRKSVATLTWTSSYMKKSLLKYNIGSNKTYNKDFVFPFEAIPSHLQRHFVRGFLDGDGSIEAASGTLTVTFISTSFLFLEQIGKLFELVQEGIGYKINFQKGKTIDYFYLRINFNRKNKPEKVLAIYNYLYKDSTIFFKRKKYKLESYLKYRGKLEN